ncbi:hypothetical protein KFL_000190210 [Klebsormidium nitens]|uniref:Uncharacterized protein n=1 Tax=Klebsormidium nitens TaxID=105231 RepID=A0A1Y1HM87_KLENI|nr:hypothetical protein KFL_000190210 [Klebsormidium nitens]|eukprot:GAQ78802.1 hypothetical protein KFL_000190210 [Klebsormidium nitens]
MSSRRASNGLIAGGLILFAVGGMSLPFFLSKRTPSLSDSNRPLSPDAVGRGPYVNSEFCNLYYLSGEHVLKTLVLTSAGRRGIRPSKWTADEGLQLGRQSSVSLSGEAS